MNDELIPGATLEGLQKALRGMNALAEVPGYAKATFNQPGGGGTTGLQAYDLEPGAKLLYPRLTPLRNMIPRVSGAGGIQANWRAIVGVNTTNISSGVSEGNRNAVINAPTQDYLAAYRGLGYESNASFEAQYAGETFENVRARAAQAGLNALMLDEEFVLLHGNGTVALGTTGAPSLSASASGGTLATMTLSVIAVGLTPDGYRQSSVAGGVKQSFVRTNADASTDTVNQGTAQKSTNTTVSVTGATGSATATVTAQRGAAAYAWYWGVAGSETLGAITTVPKLVITATATGTQLASALTATDNSVNGLVFSGLLYIALTSGSGSYWGDLGGAPLTSDGTSGINEFNVALKDRWDNYRFGPDTIWVSAGQAKDITAKVLSNAATSAMRFSVDVTKQGMIAGGSLVTTYLNPYGMDGPTTLDIRVHPNLTPGTVLMTSSRVPYKDANIDNVFQVRTRQEYYQIEWPLRSRKYEYGVYVDQVLQHYYPPSMVVLTGIGAG